MIKLRRLRNMKLMLRVVLSKVMGTATSAEAGGELESRRR
jgi:hypothetical protein